MATAEKLVAVAAAASEVVDWALAQSSGGCADAEGALSPVPIADRDCGFIFSQTQPSLDLFTVLFARPPQSLQALARPSEPSTSMRAVARMAVPMALCGCAAAFAPAGWGLRLKGAVPRALAPVPRSPRRSEQKRVLMQLSNLGGNTDKAAETSVDDFKKDGKSLTLLEKEQLYLECCASWNVEQKALLTDDEFETLKEDLEFEGSQVVLMMS